MDRLYLLCEKREYDGYCEELAERLSAGYIHKAPLESDDILLLTYGDEGLSLCKGSMKLRADFSAFISRTEKNKLFGEMLIKAVGVKNLEKDPLIMDATAGLGEDAFLLAAAGFRVKMFERDAVIAELLKDGLKRGLQNEDTAEAVSRMELVCDDSIKVMKESGIKPDVIYLDPMFPARNKSGLIKKKFQILQQLESPCEEEQSLFDAAVSTGASKIIVKRPLKGDYIAGRKPGYSIKGRAIRYDCYVN